MGGDCTTLVRERVFFAGYKLIKLKLRVNGSRKTQRRNFSAVCCFKHRDIAMCKMKFTLNGIVGHPYGSSFIVRDGQLVKATSYDLDGCSADQGQYLRH